MVDDGVNAASHGKCEGCESFLGHWRSTAELFSPGCSRTTLAPFLAAVLICHTPRNIGSLQHPMIQLMLMDFAMLLQFQWVPSAWTATLAKSVLQGRQAWMPSSLQPFATHNDQNRTTLCFRVPLGEVAIMLGKHNDIDDGQPEFAGPSSSTERPASAQEGSAARSNHPRSTAKPVPIRTQRAPSGGSTELSEHVLVGSQASSHSSQPGVFSQNLVHPMLFLSSSSISKPAPSCTGRNSSSQLQSWRHQIMIKQSAFPWFSSANFMK